MSHGRQVNRPTQRRNHRRAAVHIPTMRAVIAPVGVSDANHSATTCNRHCPVNPQAAMPGRSQAAMTSDQWPWSSRSTTNGL